MARWEEKGRLGVWGLGPNQTIHFFLYQSYREIIQHPPFPAGILDRAQIERE